MMSATLPPMVDILLAVVLGAVLGSFASAVSWRLPRHLPFANARSVCTSCQRPLKAWDLIPIISWLLARGKCRQCGSAVSGRYVGLELLCAVMAVLIFAIYPDWGQRGVLLLILTLSAVHMMIDFEHGLLLNKVTVAMIPALLLWHVVVYAHLPYGHIPVAQVLADIGYGVAFGGGLGLFLRYGFYVLFRKEGLGWGDVKFLPVMGIVVPFALWAPVLLIAGILGVITAAVWRMLGKGAQFPFGPALLCALWCALLIPRALMALVATAH
jgi:leader peptidase (prepilin peptidase)/N-methyltransferase